MTPPPLQTQSPESSTQPPRPNQNPLPGVTKNGENPSRDYSAIDVSAILNKYRERKPQTPGMRMFN